MNSNDKLKAVYKLYSEKKYSEALALNNEILSVEPNNIYAKRYAGLLGQKMGGANGKEKVKVKAKDLKCPHCVSKIGFSGLTESQQKEIKSGNYNNLEIKCPYCNTKFVMQKRSAKSILGIKVGNKATIEGKKYRTVGYIEYKGDWNEYNSGRLSESGGLIYLEWILLGEDNSYYYFSEGVSTYSGGSETEFELSKKIVPNFSIDPDYKGKSIKIDGSRKYFSEIDNIGVNSIYGENSKVYTNGEKVSLYEFEYKGKNYVIEKESAGSQIESAIYESKTISGGAAKKIFNLKGNINVGNSSSSNNSIGWWIFGAIVAINLFIDYIWYVLGIGLLLIIMYSFKDKLGEKFYNIILFGLILGPMFALFIVKPIINHYDVKTTIALEKIIEGDKFEANISASEIGENKAVSTKRYDYGGIETKYEQKTDIKFSVQSKEDKELIEKIKDLFKNNGNDEKKTYTKQEETVKKMFSNTIKTVE